MRKKIGIFITVLYLLIAGAFAQVFAQSTTPNVSVYEGNTFKEGFGSLKEAAEKYKDKKYTIKLTRQNSEFNIGAEGIHIQKSTLDLNDHTVNIEASSIKFTDATITNSGAQEARFNTNKKNLFLNGNVTINNVSIVANVLVYEGEKLVFACDGIAVAGNNQYFQSQYTIKLNSDNFGIGASNLTIENATLDINGKNVNVNPGNGTLTFKNAIVINSQSNIPTITISNGKTLVFDGATLIHDGKYRIKGDNAILNLLNTTVGNANTLASATEPFIELTNNSELNVNSSTIQNISNSSSSPIVVSGNSQVTIRGNSSFKNNNGYLGGAMNIKESNITISGTKDIKPKFENNSATHGGALRIWNCKTVNISNATFTDNKAGEMGSGGALDIRNSEVTIQGTTFTENGKATGDQSKSTNHGGAIATYAGNKLTIIGCNFNNNSSKLGGGIYAEGVNLDILASDENVKSIFNGNSANSGGAIFADNYGKDQPDYSGKQIQMVIDGAEFKDNTASGIGGAVAVGGSSYTFNDRPDTSLEGIKATIDNAEFTSNKVTNAYDEIGGGALYVHNDAWVEMKDVAITGNSTIGAGGAIATCPYGRGKVLLREGAAIFDNVATGAANSYGADYQDIYLLNIENEHKIVEPMFNGGIHNWIKKIVTTTFHDQPELGSFTGFIAGSAPSNRSIENASVLFQSNTVATNKANPEWYLGSGGAIGNNGIVIIGEQGDTLGLKITKRWDDDNNLHGIRPSIEEFFQSIQIVDDCGDTDYTEVSFKDKRLNVLSESDRRYNGLKEKYGTDRLYWCVHEDAEKDPLLIFAADKGNEYILVINGLPFSANNKHLEYAVHEINPSQYVHVTAQKKLSDGKGEVGVLGEPAGWVFDVELDNVLTSETTDIQVRKKWLDDENEEGVRPESLKVHLLVNGETSGFVFLNEENNWTARFESLPLHVFGQKMEYSVMEDVPEKYKMEMVQDGTYEYTFINTWVRDRFVFEKEWIGGNGGEISFTVYDAQGKRINTPAFKKRQINENTWRYEAEIPDCGEFTVIENPVDGFKTIYQNRWTHSDVQDKCYPGGKIINIRIPETGDQQDMMPYILGTMLSVVAIVFMIVIRKKNTRR